MMNIREYYCIAGILCISYIKIFFDYNCNKYSTSVYEYMKKMLWIGCIPYLLFIIMYNCFELEKYMEFFFSPWWDILLISYLAGVMSIFYRKIKRYYMGKDVSNMPKYDKALIRWVRICGDEYWWIVCCVLFFISVFELGRIILN